MNTSSAHEFYPNGRMFPPWILSKTNEAGAKSSSQYFQKPTTFHVPPFHSI